MNTCLEIVLSQYKGLVLETLQKIHNMSTRVL